MCTTVYPLWDKSMLNNLLSLCVEPHSCVLMLPDVMLVPDPDTLLLLSALTLQICLIYPDALFLLGAF